MTTIQFSVRDTVIGWAGSVSLEFIDENWLELVSLGLSLCVALYWSWQGRVLKRFLAHSLFPLWKGDDFPRNWVSVSVIFAAKDEQDNIDQSMENLVQLDYPNLEIIVVNDRSTDSTGEKLKAWQEKFPQLIRYVEVSELPEGWVGKGHALTLGTRWARGEYLILTDADVQFHPATIKTTVRYAEDRGISALALIPRYYDSTSVLGEAYTSFFIRIMLVGLGTHIRKNAQYCSYAGIGAFNMIKREVYFAVGGHQTLRMNVDEDIRLAELLKVHGYPSVLRPGHHLVEVQWAQGVWGLVKVLEKSIFASMHYSTWILISHIIQYIFGLILPFVMMIWAQGVAQFLWAHASLMIVGQSVLLALNLRMRVVGWWPFPLYPLLGLVAIVHSGVKTLVLGGVKWRGHFYSIESLKRQAWKAPKGKIL